MNIKKILSMFLVAGIATTSLAGCGGATASKSSASSASGSSKDGEQITLKVWAPQEDQVATSNCPNGVIPYLCDKFNEEHPEWNIKFDISVMPENNANKEILKDVDAAADVFMYANDQIPSLVEAGAIAKLGGKTVDDVKANNSAAMVGSVTYNDGVYGVPYTPNTYFMYYDKSKYSDDDVKSLDTMMAKQLPDGDVNFAYAVDNSWYITAFYYAAGGELFGPDGTDESKGVTFGEHPEVTEYLADLVANPKFLNEKDGASLSKFKEGKLGAYVTGSWDAAAIKEALGDNMGVTKLPTIKLNGEDKQMMSFAGSKAMGVNPKCKNMQVAVALAAYLGGEEAQKVHFTERGYIPTWKSLTESAEVKADPVASACIKEINEASKTQPMVKKITDYWSPAEAIGKSLVQGDVTKANAADATKQMAEAMNK